MQFAAIPDWYFPRLWMTSTAAYVQDNPTLLNAASKATAYIFQLPRTESIDEIGFSIGTVTSGGDMTVTLETVNTTTGDPTGTLYHANATASVSLVVGDSNTWKKVSFGGDVPVAMGDYVALVFRNAAVSSPSWTLLGGNSSFLSGAFPYLTDYDGVSTWTKNISSSTTIMPMFCFYYDTAALVNGEWRAAKSVTDVAISNAGTLDAVGVRFKFPISVTLDNIRAGKVELDSDYTIYLTDDSLNTLYSKAYDTDFSNNSSSNTVWELVETTLLANTFYRFFIVSGGSSGTQALQRLDYNSSAELAADYRVGQFSAIERTRVGATWTEYSDKVYPIHFGRRSVNVARGGMGGAVT